MSTESRIQKLEGLIEEAEGKPAEILLRVTDEQIEQAKGVWEEARERFGERLRGLNDEQPGQAWLETVRFWARRLGAVAYCSLVWGNISEGVQGGSTT